MNEPTKLSGTACGFRVSVVCDSIAQGVRLTTFAVRMPRVVLAEVLTHRQLSRNASSSRAIPVSHIVDQVKNDPYMPGDLPDGEWRGNNPGMEAVSPLTREQQESILFDMHKAKDSAVSAALCMSLAGGHKQDVNRVVEPFQWIRWLCTATDLDNFFALRTDHRAYPPFRFLARCMFVAYQRSTPKQQRLHLPFITEDDFHAESDMVDPPEWWPNCWNYARREFNLMAWSAARCARVSVKNFRTNDTDRAKDMETFRKLTTEYPRHSSPAEHPAVASGVLAASRPSNFRSPWCQFRKFIPQETVHEFAPSADEVASWNVPDGVFGGVPGVDW
jgi:thymidylate synthase ThyX